MERKTFSTSDLYLSSALRISGFKLVDVKKDGSGKGTFVFEDRPDRSAFVQKYFLGELTGSLKAFANQWADLKNLLAQM